MASKTAFRCLQYSIGEMEVYYSHQTEMFLHFFFLLLFWWTFMDIPNYTTEVVQALHESC